MCTREDTKKYIILPNKKDFNEFKAKGFNSFILPLEKYSIGFDVYFSISEIKNLSNKFNIYIMINKFLHKKELFEIENLFKNFNFSNIKGIFIEDLSLTKLIPNEKIIIYQNHMINNYESINFFKSLGFENVVINNALTIEEIKEIRNKTTSKLCYFLISKNILMYSKRKLVSNYFENFNLEKTKEKYNIKEEVTKKEFIVKEENGSSTISNNVIFCANKFINELEKLDFLIINLTNINEEENIILENFNSDKLQSMINSDYYFLEKEIKYKIGDIK